MFNDTHKNVNPFNIVTNISLHCHEIKETRSGNLIANCFFKAKKRPDGTYPSTPWVSVFINNETRLERPVANVEEFKRIFTGKAISVGGRIKADSWTDRNGVEHPNLTIFATNMGLTFND